MLDTTVIILLLMSLLSFLFLFHSRCNVGVGNKQHTLHTVANDQHKCLEEILNRPVWLGVVVLIPFVLTLAVQIKI